MSPIQPRWALPATLVIFAAGCQGPHSEESLDPELEVPSAWTAGDPEPGQVPGDWWELFADEQLNGLVTAALAENRDLRATAARVDAAAASARIAGAALRPNVGLSGNAARQRLVFVGLPIPGSGGSVLSSTTNNFGVSLDLSWEADLWGRLRAGQRAALTDLHAADLELRAAELSLAAQVSKAWFALAEARSQADLAQRTVDSFLKTEEIVQRRFEGGLVTALDLRLARSNAADAKATLEERENLLQLARRQVELLLGEYPDASIEGRAELPSIPGPIPAGLPAQILGRRPDLLSARARLVAADLRVAEAEAALLPSLRLTASGGTASNDLGDLLDGDFSVWSIAGGVTAPLFEGGRLRAQVELREAGVDEALWLYAQRALLAFAEVETALGAEGHLARQEADLETAWREASEAERLADERYRSGLSGLVTVLEAQRRAFGSESRWIGVRRARLDNRVDLALALGGPWSDAPKRGQGEDAEEGETGGEADAQSGDELGVEPGAEPGSEGGDVEDSDGPESNA